MSQPALSGVTVTGFKSIASIEKLALRSINILIGANGSGKSNFVGVFALLHALREGRLQDYVVRAGGANRLLHFGSKVTSKIRVRVEFQGGVNRYEITLKRTEADELVPAGEVASFWDKKRYPAGPLDQDLTRRGKEAGISDPGLRRTPGWVRQHLGGWRIYHFHDTSTSSPMKQTADVNDNRFLRPNASNLSAFLYFLNQKEQDAYVLIRSAVQRVAPFVDDFCLEPMQLNPDKIRIEWKHKGSDLYFDASSLSDGTLRFVALATLLLQPKQYRPSLILIDEPELGLHPAAITMLASLIKTASHETQVIVSTQSSILLDHFDPEDVLVADRVQGGTQITRLDPGRLSAWLEDYSLGQLWEKNELGGRPVGE